MDVISLTKKLVALPSAKSTHGTYGSVEADMAKGIEGILKKALPERWRMEHQPVTKNRYNLFVHDGTPTRLLLIGHMDTVEIGDGWTKNALGKKEGNLLYGRGTADMKSGNAVIMTSLIRAAKRNIPGIAGLFYCDEEYEFLGMKTFVKKQQKPPTIELVVCPEPTNLGIRNGVRGCVEYQLIIQGKRGHAARPKSGVNAFRALVKAVTALDTACAKKKNSKLGIPTVNIAGVSCGTFGGRDKKGNAILLPLANVIPDYCEATIEIRTIPEMNRKDIEQTLRRSLESLGAKIISMELRSEMKSYLTPHQKLSPLKKAQKTVLGKVQYDNPARGGYSDIQMLAEHWNVPCALIGPQGKNMHGPDEYVDLNSVKTLEKMFHQLIEQYRIP